jgi:flagellin
MKARGITAGSTGATSFATLTVTFAQGSAVHVDDQAHAKVAIGLIDAAIKTVNTQRSELGAVSNRLSHTVSNMTNISTNLSAARGGIEDADFALETTNLAKNQILQQASTAMLAQANASKQNVLSLLQG